MTAAGRGHARQRRLHRLRGIDIVKCQEPAFVLAQPTFDGFDASTPLRSIALGQTPGIVSRQSRRGKSRATNHVPYPMLSST